MKHFLLFFVFPLTFATPVIAVESECVTVELEERATESINIKKLCVGDEVFSMQTKQMAKITEIDKSGKEYDKNAPAFFVIKDVKGKTIKMTDEEVVMNNKKTCLTNYHNVKMCVGDKYIGLSDGKEHVIEGFTLPTGKTNYTQVLVRGADNVFEKDSTMDSFDSIKATQTGLIFSVGSCSEGVLPSFEATLKKCALKDMVSSLEQKCSQFTNGSGKAIYDLKSKDIKLECNKEYSMIGTSTKTCSAVADLKCERVADVQKDLKETAKVVIDGTARITASAKDDDESKVSDSSRNQIKAVQQDSDGKVLNKSSTLSK